MTTSKRGSARIKLTRTTAFRMTDEHFGTVHVYRPGPTFTRAWHSLKETWRSRPERAEPSQLPYGSLATALRVLTGDFVALERYAGDGQAFVISRKPIGEADLRSAIGAWETRALGVINGAVSRAVGDLRHEEVHVASYIHRRNGSCPAVPAAEGWIWQVAVWEAAHRLAASPMPTDHGTIRWRLDSDAALLSWDDLIRSPRDGDASAMHKLALRLVTVPGVEDPVLSIHASLVRLAPKWSVTGGVKYAWAELTASSPLVRAVVRTRRDGKGTFTTAWDDRAVEVLLGATLDPLPRIEEPGPTGAVRAGYRKQPRWHPLGRGVGPWFYECAFRAIVITRIGPS